MPRYDWTEADLARNLETLLTDPLIRANLDCASAHIPSRSGTEKAAALLDQLVRR
jgi:UDP:flavonoid glycosyltransferase YjiC (YdhE family)